MRVSRGVRAGLGAVSWLVLGAAVVVLGALVAVPRLARATPFVVLTGSMEPAISPGDVVVVRPVPARDLAVGAVVTYQLHSGRPEVVTHRVVSQGLTGDGGVVLRTRGDANAVVDAAPVLAAQVRGEVWYVVPGMGHVTTLLDQGLRRGLSWVAALGLFGYAALMLRRGRVEARRPARHAPPRPTSPRSRQVVP